MLGNTMVMSAHIILRTHYAHVVLQKLSNVASKVLESRYFSHSPYTFTFTADYSNDLLPFQQHNCEDRDKT